MEISSIAFENNQLIPKRFTCDGDNISPPLSIENSPDNAKSMALVVEDPDAPGGIWTHWLIWNIAPDTSEIPSGVPPEDSIEGTNSNGNIGYSGPCPPNGTHRYRFVLYALTTKDLGLSPDSERADFLEAISENILSQSIMTGTYHR